MLTSTLECLSWLDSSGDCNCGGNDRHYALLSSHCTFYKTRDICLRFCLPSFLAYIKLLQSPYFRTIVNVNSLLWCPSKIKTTHPNQLRTLGYRCTAGGVVWGYQVLLLSAAPDPTARCCLGVALGARLQSAHGDCATDSSGNKTNVYSPTVIKLFLLVQLMCEWASNVPHSQQSIRPQGSSLQP